MANSNNVKEIIPKQSKKKYIRPKNIFRLKHIHCRYKKCTHQCIGRKRGTHCPERPADITKFFTTPGQKSNALTHFYLERQKALTLT